MATKEQINQIKARIDIVDVIGRYVKLKRVGKNWAGLCPFHNEKTPSFFVNPQLGIFKCFGCGKAGDVITFLQEIEHITFYEALERLAKEAGVTLESLKTDKDYSKLKKAKELLKKIALAYHKLLTSHSVGQKARAYAKKRGLTSSLIDKFLLGYAPGDRYFAQKLAKKLGFSDEDLKLAGLVNERGLDRFFDRLMFPIFDASGNIVGFSGRVIDKDDIRAKYLNSPDSELFKKRFLLYGLYQAKNAIASKNQVWLVEGQMDVISASRVGLDNIVAPLGTGVTETQFMVLKRYAENVVLSFDADQAGQKALLRAASLAFSQGFNVYVFKVPEGAKDLDEAIEKLGKKIVEYKPVDFVEYAIDILKGELENSQYQDFERSLKKILEVVKNAPDIKQEVILKRFADAFDISLEALKGYLDQATSPKVSLDQESESVPLKDYFVQLLLNFPGFVLSVADDKVVLSCLKGPYLEFFTTISAFVKEVAGRLKISDPLKLNEILEGKLADEFKLNVIEPLKLNPATLSLILKSGVAKESDLSSAREEFLKVVKRLKLQCLSAKLRELNQDLTEVELRGQTKKVEKLSKKVAALVKMIRDLKR